MDDNQIASQLAICKRFNVSPMPAPPGLKVGISKNVKGSSLPINGLRLAPVADTSGWYIWVEEWSDDDDFFVPLHVEHLQEWCPSILPYLQLPPGWRFLIAQNHVDVWEDASLINGQ